MWRCGHLSPSMTCAEFVDGSLAVALADTAINPLQRELHQAQVVLQHVQHDLELAEDQHLRSAALLLVMLHLALA